MKRVKMLETVGGAKEGDVVGFESDAEADALIEAKKAEPHVEALTLTAADVGKVDAALVGK